MVTHMKTTVEISDPLAEEAKAVAGGEKTTLRALIEEGLRHVLRERRRETRFELRDASFRGHGLQPEFQDGDWRRIREAAYEGHGG
ncbi:MAG: type II toxin-antitoxin system VapB family antitoxin [Deltaproteobacteria bacterium]|nr:type II toxin-antitoxin system VapB family antitoxin [Deltaproteobacteria bacterium]MBW2418951.1 type II toxin-antitoxin system VapB family antitoxin [Deltaproteobacteria bacterium]